MDPAAVNYSIDPWRASMKCQDTPCKFCPYRKDVPSGVWSSSEYEKLLRYDNETMYQPMHRFACHNDPELACTGWLAVSMQSNHAHESLALRIRPVDVSSFAPDTEFFQTHTEACVHGLRDIDNPSQEAEDAMIVLGRIVERR